MTGTTAQAAAQDTWREVIALLVQAADVGYRDAEANPALHSPALGARLMAAWAVGLLPPELDHLLDDVVLEPRTESMSMAELIAAAEAATRRHPIEELPIGASRVIVDICDLVRETRQ